jgi:hypothetical protein
VRFRVAVVIAAVAGIAGLVFMGGAFGEPPTLRAARFTKVDLPPPSVVHRIAPALRTNAQASPAITRRIQENQRDAGNEYMNLEQQFYSEPHSAEETENSRYYMEAIFDTLDAGDIHVTSLDCGASVCRMVLTAPDIGSMIPLGQHARDGKAKFSARRTPQPEDAGQDDAGVEVTFYVALTKTAP